MSVDELKLLMGAGAIPLVMFLTELIKPFVNDHRFYPIISLVWGIIINLSIILVINGISPLNFLVGAVLGVTTALAASGTYSAVAAFRASQ